MYNPLVSIIIPVYNGSNYLEESINSALGQTYENIEVIVVNDGSRDNGATERIALSYGSKIRYFCKENGGTSTALNLGIEKMTGEWFSWLSHDDLYVPTKIESQVQAIESNNLDPDNTIISCRSIFVDKKGQRVPRVKRKVNGLLSSEELFKGLFKGRSPNGCALLIPRVRLLEVGGFDPSYRYMQDWTCWVSLALAGCQLFTLDKALVMTRIHSNQQTKKIGDLLPSERERFLNDMWCQLERDLPLTREHLQTILFYTTRINRRDIGLAYAKTLRTHGLFPSRVRLEYLLRRVQGKVIYNLKQIYRMVMNFKYRGGLLGLANGSRSKKGRRR